MKLSEESQKSLDHIRFKVVRQQYDLKGIEAQCLAQVFEEIQLTMVGKKVRLNIGCSGCIKTAVNVVYNFINSHEERTATNQANVTQVKVVKPVITFSDVKTSEVTLQELRVMHPHIKATSVKVFMQKLEDEKSI